MESGGILLVYVLVGLGANFRQLFRQLMSNRETCVCGSRNIFSVGGAPDAQSMDLIFRTGMRGAIAPGGGEVSGTSMLPAERHARHCLCSEHETGNLFQTSMVMAWYHFNEPNCMSWKPAMINLASRAIYSRSGQRRSVWSCASAVLSKL